MNEEDPLSERASEARYGATPRFEDSSAQQCHALIFASFLCIACIAEGYDYGVTNGAIVRMKEDLKCSTLELSIFVTALPLGVMMGAPLGGVFADYFGRKFGLTIQCCLLTVGPICTALAPELWMMTVARLVTGFGIGMGFVVISMYISETSPRNMRGRLTALEEVWINVGVLSGFLATYLLFGIKHDWRWMIGLGSVPSLIMVVASMLPQVPESPRWLYMHDRIDEARKVLEVFLSPEEVQHIIMDYESSKKQKFATWNELLFPPPQKAYVRQMLIASIVVATSNALCGGLILGYYSSTILSEEYTERIAYIATLIMGVVKTFVVIVLVLFLIDKVGRRTLIILSTVITMLSCFYIACGFWFSWAWLEVAIGFWLFHVGFSLGQGPLAWVYCSEVFETEFRAKGMGLSMFIRGLCGTCSVLAFPLVAEIIGNAQSFFWLAVINAVFVVGFWFVVFETSAKSLERMHKIFEGSGDSGPH